MQTNILWTGREYYSLENCLINTSETGAEIASTIIGSYQGKIYQVAYEIKTNAHWETVFVAIRSRHSNQMQTIQLQGDGKGNWVMDGKEAEQFNGCIDVDISLTPFTNTLPIRRLKLQNQQEQVIQVVYFDLMEQRMAPVRQQYRRLSATEYRYENIPNDFESNIVVDESGFVVDYPSLFVRSAAIKTAYGLPAAFN
ncbi:putative glycolipid-binding domain-containing protein [Longitalea arenae]|uniref:putative glycolipid-binding domain-containing protein n=1 Tax=Longitalea arenae TaxID=2812558 RepID=UPI0019678102|nr:putative glycolipid-binding domain-containing protein [Longitalea arenae]